MRYYRIGIEHYLVTPRNGQNVEHHSNEVILTASGLPTRTTQDGLRVLRRQSTLSGVIWFYGFGMFEPSTDLHANILYSMKQALAPDLPMLDSLIVDALKEKGCAAKRVSGNRCTGG